MCVLLTRFFFFFWTWRVYVRQRECWCVCVCAVVWMFSSPLQAWVLQSWYSTGVPLQAKGALLPSRVAQVRFRVRYPLAQSWEQADQVSHDDQPDPATRTTGVFRRSSTRAERVHKCLCFCNLPLCQQNRLYVPGIQPPASPSADRGLQVIDSERDPGLSPGLHQLCLLG